MYIQDFHTKFTSSNEPCHLFRALRSLSLVEDLKATLGAGAESTTMGDWVEWPPEVVEPPGAAPVVV